MIIPSFLPIGYDHVQTFTMAKLIISHGVSVQHVDLEPLWARLASDRAGQQVANWRTTELHWNWKAPFWKRPDRWSGANHLSVTMCVCVCVTLFLGILCRIYYRWSKCNLFLAAAILVSWMKGSLVRPWRCQLCRPMAGEKNLSQSFSLCQLRQTGGWGHSFSSFSSVQICGWSCYTKNWPNLWKSLFETSWNDPLQVFQDGDRLA